VATNKDFIVKNGLSVGEDISVSGSVTSNLQFDDTVQAQFGTDSDAFVAHSGSEFQINNSTGQLDLRSVSRILLTASGSETMITATAGGSVILSNSGNPKLETTSTGVDITGNAVLTGELRGPASFVIDPATVGDNTGEVVIKGDLTVEGTQTTVNSTTLDVADKNITLNHGSGDTSATADQAGITIQDAVNSTTDATILWTTSNDRFNFSHPVAVTGDIIGSGSLQIVRSAAGAASVLLQRNGAAGSWSLAQGHTATNYFEILEGSNTRMTIANGGATTFPGNLTSNGTITGADYSGITMGGSLSGSHDDAKVQYGNSFSGTPAQGHFFFDALNQKLKVYTGSAFVDAVPSGGGGGGGGGSSDATATFRKYTYTLTSSTNAVSGKEDDEVTTTNFISGRKYEITAVGNTDFQAIGAGSNAVGVQFIATGVGGGTTGKAKEVLFYTTGGTQNIEVYVNGVKAVEGSANDYVATTGTSVTFTSNLAVGDVVDIQVYELLTNDSYYLKTQTYTQAEVNTQITTGTSAYLPIAGGNMTGNISMNNLRELRSFDTDGTSRTLLRVNSALNSSTTKGELEIGWSGQGPVKFMGGGSYTERMRIHTNSNIGINDVAPHGTLTVTGPRILVQRANDDSSIAFANNTTGAPAGHVWAAGLNYSNSNAFTIAYGASGVPSLESHKMVINTSGNVGIGTDSPFAKYHIKDTGWSSAAPYGTVQLIEGNNVNDANWGHLVITDTTTANGNGGAISFATGASTALNPFSGIKGVSEGASWGGIGFYSRPQSGTATRRMTITSSGNVGIGTPSPAEKFEVAGTALVGNSKLKEISKSNTDTALDVFVYDTRKDSDGGAWRKRTQNTSWYNEALGTSTRGARKEFPCVAVIVAESNQVTIYDGDDPDMPMWMVFNVTNSLWLKHSGSDGCRAVVAKNGIMVTGGDLRGSIVRFIADDGNVFEAGYNYEHHTIATRNSSGVGPSTGPIRIANNEVNDVAITVLPNAPIDYDTGLPVPTIAIATVGGLSVIKDDGKVVDIKGHVDYNFIETVDFTTDNKLIYSMDYSGYARYVRVDNIPESDFAVTATNGNPHLQENSLGFYTYNNAELNDTIFLAPNGSHDRPVCKNAIGSTVGLTILDSSIRGRETSDYTLVNYVGHNFNTGWHHGDVVTVATMSDTDTTNAVGTELVTNGTFTSNTTGWTVNSNGTFTSVSGRGRVTNTQTGDRVRANSGAMATVVGKHYTLSFETYNSGGFLHLGNTSGGVEYKTNLGLNGNGKFTHTFVATGTEAHIQIGASSTTNGQYAEYDNISLRLAEADRTAGGTTVSAGKPERGFQVFGTVTKTAVETGADLVAYSGFSGANHLYQPYNSNFDFGTGDCSYTWWSSAFSSGSDRIWLAHGKYNTAGMGLNVLQYNSGGTGNEAHFYLGNAGAGYIIVTGVENVGWDCWTVTRKAGIMSVYRNGKLQNSVANTNNVNLSSATFDGIHLGVGVSGSSVFGYGANQMALFRVSRIATLADQAEQIYNDEKHLFTANAGATLVGSSSSISALDYDDDTDLLHVGSVWGRSVFRGLSRIEYHTDYVPQYAISASNGMVAEE